MIEETEADLILTIGTSGAVFENFGVGDVVITRGAKFRLNDEFKNETFNGQSYNPIGTSRPTMSQKPRR